MSFDNQGGVAYRLRKGLSAQICGQVINIFVRIAEVPIFLTFWGAERYGEWLMVAAIPAYLALADGGFTGATQREMTMRMGAGDREGALILFQSTWLLLLMLSTLLLGCALVAFTLTPIDQWLVLGSMHGETITAVILLLLLHTLIGFQCGLIYGGYSCEGRYARGTYLWVLMLSLDFVGLSLGVAFGEGPVEAALGFLIGRFVGFLVFLKDLRGIAPWLVYGLQYASKTQIARLLRPSLASMAFPLGEALNTQGMRLAVGVTLGPAAVTVFSTIRTLCRSAMKPTVVISRLIEPELALAFGANNKALISRLFIHASQIALWLALFASLVLWVGGEPVLRLWGRGEITMEKPLYILLVLASFINSLWYVALMVPYATNQHGRVAVFFLLSNMALLFIAMFLMESIGISGAGIAILAFELSLMTFVLFITLSLSGVSFRQWLHVISKPPFDTVRNAINKKARGKINY